MMPTRKALTIVTWMALAVAPAAAFGAEGAPTTTPDRIVTRTATLTGLEILSADTTGVSYKKYGAPGGASGRVSAEEIRDIGWGDAPGDFRRAVSAINESKFDAALRQLQSSPDKGPREFWYGPYRLFLIGQCFAKLGRHAEAIPKFDEVIRQYPKSLYFLDALQGKAEACMALTPPRYEEVAQTYAMLDPMHKLKDPRDGEPYGKLLQLRGAQGAAEAYAHIPARTADVGRLYEDIAQVTEAILADPPANLKPNVPEIRLIQQRSLVGKGEVLLRSNKPDEAWEWVNSVSGKITEPAVRMKMYQTLGDALMERANKAPAADKKPLYKKAMLAYLHVYILFPDQKADRPKIMLNAGTASQLLDTPADSTRAVRLYKELMAEFPASAEAKEAKNRLEAMGVKP